MGDTSTIKWDCGLSTQTQHEIAFAIPNRDILLWHLHYSKPTASNNSLKKELSSPNITIQAPYQSSSKWILTILSSPNFTQPIISHNYLRNHTSPSVTLTKISFFTHHNKPSLKISLILLKCFVQICVQYSLNETEK